MSREMMVWAIAALGLMAAELLLPEIFLLWLGIAAAAMFFVVWAVPELAPVWQAVGFVLFSFLSVGAYVKFIRNKRVETSQPLLNKRGEQMVGRVLPLHEPIVNGHGRVKLGDALWTVEGPDLPAGHSVRIVGVDSMTLKVEAA